MKKELQLFKRILPILAAIIFCCTCFTPKLQAQQDIYVVTKSDGTFLGSTSVLQYAMDYAIQGDSCIITMQDNDISDGLGISAGFNITLTSNGGPFILKTLSTGRHISGNNCKFTLNDVILEGNEVAENSHDYVGGGVEVREESTFIMNSGATIRNCSANNLYEHNRGGAGVFIAYNSTFIMNGGSITNNKVGAAISYPGHEDIPDYGGAGVRIEWNSRFEMHGGVISDNHSVRNGAGVYVGSLGGAIFDMFGGTISNNTAENGNTSVDGGGVYLNDNATMNMFGGVITENYATHGGGVCVHGFGSELTMNGGTIIGNTAIDGAGVYNRRTMFIQDGEIKNNTADLNGGGVYMVKGLNDMNDIFAFFGVADLTELVELAGYNDISEVLTAFGLSHVDELFDYIIENMLADQFSNVYLNMSGGKIYDNHAPNGDGGGIYTENFNYDTPIDAYKNIKIDNETWVYGNTSSEEYSAPTVAGWADKHNFDISLLTNHQINYRGSNIEIETLCAGDSITLEAIVAEELGVTYTYQWYRNEQKVNGKTGVAYTITDPQDGDVVYCVVKSNAECSDSIKTNAITINVKTKPVAPYVSPSEFETCIKTGTITLGDLDVKYTDIQWYADVDCKSELPLSTTIDQDTNYYYFTQIVNGCESDPTQYTVIINPNMIVPPPALPDTIEFCQDLKGSLLLEEISSDPNLHWYTDNQGQNLVDPQIPISNDVIFYVTQTVGECSSTTYTEVFIQFVNQFEKAPKIDTTLYFCTGALLSDLNIRINYPLALQWFTSQIPGATPLANNSVLASGTYYAQIVHDGNCLNGAFAEVKVMVGESQSTPKEMEVCEDITLSSIALTGNGIIKWFKEPAMTTPLSSDVVTEIGETYYAAFTSSNCSYLAYVVTAKTCDCDVELTSSTTKEICSGEEVDYAITTESGVSIIGWSRTVPGFKESNSTNHTHINETLTNNTSSPINVEYTVKLQKPGCSVVEKYVTVTVKPFVPVSAKLKLKKN